LHDAEISENQLGRSLKNLGVDCVDVYYLHNPRAAFGSHEGRILGRVRDIYVSRISRPRRAKFSISAGHVERLSAGRRVRGAMQLGEISQ